MRRAARSLATVGRNDHWQLAKNPIPTYKSIRAIRALQNLLQNWRRKPHGLPVFKGHGKQLNLDQIITAQVCNPHGRVDEHFTSSRRAGRLRIVVLGNATRAAKRENSRVVAAAHVVLERDMDGVASCLDLGDSLYARDELGVENNIRALSTRSADWFHVGTSVHIGCVENITGFCWQRQRRIMRAAGCVPNLLLRRPRNMQVGFCFDRTVVSACYFRTTIADLL
jgi:hypothetical protein